ncbi:MAG: hypothetical protein Q9182_005624 [Xanthomendoza sp. 2 TL-2023]
MDRYAEREDCLGEDNGNSEFAYLMGSCVAASNTMPQEIRVPLLRQDGAHTRYVRGGVKPGRSSNDLRPPSLSFGETSMIDFLNEGPPPGYDAQSNAFATPEAKSDIFKKEFPGSKISSSFRKIFSPKQRSTESKQSTLELLETFKRRGALTPENWSHVITSHGSDSTLNSTTAELLEGDLTMLPCQPAYLETPGVAPDHSSGISDPLTLHPHDRATLQQIPSSRDKHTPATSPPKSICTSAYAIESPNPSSRGAPAPVTPGSHLPSGKLHWQVPPVMVHPVISHRVLKEHLSLRNYPSVSKEDIALLPKMLEPTMVSPGYNSSQLLYGQSDWPYSASNIPNDEDEDKGKVLGKSELSHQARNSFETSMQQIQGLPKSRCQPIKNSGDSAPNTAEDSVERILQELKCKKNGEVKKNVDGDPMIKVFNDITIEKSSVAGEKRQRRANSDESSGSAHYTPLTPTSGYMTPSTPIDLLDDYYGNFPKVLSEDDRSPEMNFGDFELCSTLSYIHKDGTAATPSSIDGLHSNGQAITTPAPPVVPECSKYGLVHDRAGKIANDTEPLANASSSMGKIQRYFQGCTADTVYGSRLSMSTHESRLQVLSHLRKTTGTKAIYRNPGPGHTKHPNHGRQYHSKNLQCTDHLGHCGVCKAACCVYLEAIEASNEAKTSSGREFAFEIVRTVSQACVVPADVSTFLRCSECSRMICPECIGVCPERHCQVMTCKVSPVFYRLCDWYEY